jgi:hypothetical protein
LTSGFQSTTLSFSVGLKRPVTREDESGPLVEPQIFDEKEPSVRKHNTKLQIATTYQRWQELNGQSDHAVANLINGDSGNAERLLFIIDLMTGDQYEPQQREIFTWDVVRQAFMRTDEFETALEAYMNKINPSRQTGPRAIKSA